MGGMAGEVLAAFIHAFAIGAEFIHRRTARSHRLNRPTRRR
jgi:hypothetical protein